MTQRYPVVLIGDVGTLGAADTWGGPPLALPPGETSGGGDGWPPAVKPVAAAWFLDKDAQPKRIRYRLQNGDTLVGLAKTYLGGVPTRWKEIRAVLTEEQAARADKGKLYAGEVIDVTDEMVKGARKLKLIPWYTGRGAIIAGGAAAGAALVGTGVYVVTR